MAAILKLRLDWDYNNDRELIAPTVFEIWWDELNNILWDEFNSSDWDQDKYYLYSWEQLMKDGKAKIDMRDPKYVYPMAKVTIDLLKNHPNHISFDHRSTNNSVEVAKDVVYDSFYWTAMKFGDINVKDNDITALKDDERAYHLLESVGTKPNVVYQTKVRNTNKA